MMFAIGVVLFALAILLSVALHECGHMWAAQATGMKVHADGDAFVPFDVSCVRTLRQCSGPAVPGRTAGVCGISDGDTRVSRRDDGTDATAAASAALPVVLLP